MATEPDLVHCIYASSATRPFSFDQLVELLAVARRNNAALGVTGMLLLCESHISIHTWPEHQFAAIDLFMCGDTRPELAADYLAEALSAEQRQWRDIIRGEPT